MKNANPIAELRGHLALSQEEFAEVLGVTQSQISAWEVGQRAMLAETALQIWDKQERLLAHLGFTLEDLIRLNR